MARPRTSMNYQASSVLPTQLYCTKTCLDTLCMDFSHISLFTCHTQSMYTSMSIDHALTTLAPYLHWCQYCYSSSAIIQGLEILMQNFWNQNGYSTCSCLCHTLFQNLQNHLSFPVCYFYFPLPSLH